MTNHDDLETARFQKLREFMTAIGFGEALEDRGLTVRKRNEAVGYGGSTTVTLYEVIWYRLDKEPDPSAEPMISRVTVETRSPSRPSKCSWTYAFPDPNMTALHCVLDEHEDGDHLAAWRIGTGPVRRG